MAQRSNRRFLNLISVEAFEAATLIRKRAGGIHHGQESCTPPKAEYIGADQTVISIFRLQFCGGPYIPLCSLSVRFSAKNPRDLWIRERLTISLPKRARQYVAAIFIFY